MRIPWVLATICLWWSGALTPGQINLGVEYVLVEPELPGGRIGVTPNGKLLLTARADCQCFNRVGGQIWPRLNGARPADGSIVDVEIGGRAFFLGSFGAAKIDTCSVQNGTTSVRLIYFGSPFFFELSALLMGEPENPAVGRSWIRVKNIIPPDQMEDLSLSGPLNAGSTRRVYLNRPADGGLTYWISPTLFPDPGIPLPPPDTRKLPISPDILFLIAHRPNRFFLDFIGRLDSRGLSHRARIFIPSQDLVGLSFYIAYITVGVGYPSSIKSISRPRRITVVP